MKKLVVSALCALCLCGAFAATVAQTNTQDEKASELALSRRRVGVRF